MRPRSRRATQNRPARGVQKGWTSEQRVAFEFEQSLLAPQAAGVTSELAVAAQHAVAGHDEADRVASHGRAHGAHRAGPAYGACDCAIAAELALSQGQQLLPHRLLEIGAG